MLFMKHTSSVLLATLGLVHAQFPPTPEGTTIIDSKFGDGVQISYKEVSLVSLPDYEFSDLSSLGSVKRHQVSSLMVRAEYPFILFTSPIRVISVFVHRACEKLGIFSLYRRKSC